MHHGGHERRTFVVSMRYVSKDQTTQAIIADLLVPHCPVDDTRTNTTGIEHLLPEEPASLPRGIIERPPPF